MVAASELFKDNLLATVRDLATGIGMSRQRLHVHRRRYAEEGAAAVVGATRRPKTPHNPLVAKMSLI